MIRHCIYCHQAFPENEELEHLRVGLRIAFDPRRGRLWVVCPACKGWTLAPMEERWEALEELERVAMDRARALSSTENITLLRAGELDLVRVGGAHLQEEAWWRYGNELSRRRRRSFILTGAEVAILGGLAVLTGGAGFVYMGGGGLSSLVRWGKFGRTAWKGSAVCRRCGTVMERLSFRDTRQIRLVPGEDDGLEVLYACPRCGEADYDRGFHLEGASAEHLLRRTLAYNHFGGASQNRIRDAIHAIDVAGSPRTLARSVAANTASLKRLEKKDATAAIALEIALNDDVERRLLELELEALEARWREEEEIAAICDRELTPFPGLDRVLDRLRPGGRVGDGRASAA